MARKRISRERIEAGIQKLGWPSDWSDRQIALAEYLIDSGEFDLQELLDGILSSTAYDETFSVGNREYKVLTDEEADTEVYERIEQDVWAFRPEFIIAHSKLPSAASEMVASYQESKSEDANEVLKALIEDFQAFVDDAVRADGRGHFINNYDGEENEWGNFYIYRMD